MADTENHEEPTLHPKRKPDPTSDDQPDFPNKTQKLQVSGDPENPEPNSDEKNDKLDSIADPQVEEHEEDEDEEEEDYEEEEHESNGKSEVDRKGKGIMRQDKGKGILIEEDGDDDDDSSDDDDDASSDEELEDSDLSDDPLAEVDLDNILPSRTRRQQFHPGVYIRNNNSSNKEEEDDSDDSDDAVC